MSERESSSAASESASERADEEMASNQDQDEQEIKSEVLPFCVFISVSAMFTFLAERLVFGPLHNICFYPLETYFGLVLHSKVKCKRGQNG